MESLDIILSMGNVSLSTAQKIHLADKKNSWFVEYLKQMLPDEIFPGIKKLINDLRSANIKIGLASSSKNAMTVLELLGIKNMFDVIVDGNMISKSKPDPEIFLLAANKLRSKPEDCVVFEDAEAGVEAALAAGMKCVGVGSKEQLGKADKVIAKTGDFNATELYELA